MQIIVVDDERSVREAYSQILEASEAARRASRTRELASALFSETAPAMASPNQEFNGFSVAYAEQGLDAVAMVERARASGSPFKVAFIDVRMPPGIDGKETAKRIRAADPDINLVIVTAYSDHSVTDIAAVAGPPHKIFYIQKPFAASEVRQMAQALLERWDHDTQQLERLREQMVELAASEARAHHMANHDMLTGVPNRSAFQCELVNQLEHGRENLFLAFFGLNRLHNVNEMFGHETGDALLQSVVKDLQSRIPAHALLARISTDKFGLLFRAASLGEGEKLLTALIGYLSAPHSLFGQSFQLGPSCGLVACGSFPDPESHDLMRFAEMALVEAHSNGDGEVCVFDEALDSSQLFKRRIEQGLVQALERNEFSLCYQPIVSSKTLEEVGFEALLRWSSPEYGPVSPAVFIPIAEECGLMGQIGDWVTDRAICDARAWPDKLTSINVSPRQFSRGDWVERIVAVAERYGVSPDKVQLEITETALFENLEQATAVLAALRDHGFRVALDDFGTGYSSMCNLKNFEVDCVKIDRSFVTAMGKDRQSAPIVSAIGQLANSLGLTTVAEGIENEEQCDMLRHSECSHMQGYLFGKPKSASDCSTKAVAQ